MGSVYLDRSGLELRMDGAAIAVYADGQRATTIPLKLVDRLVLRGRQAKLDSDVLLRLAEQGATTVLLGSRTGRRMAVVLGPAHNDAAIRLAQARAVMDARYCTEFSREVVRAKLARQRRVLREMMAARPDARKPLFDAASAVADALASVPTIADISSLRGLEGAAARACFRGYAAVFPPLAGFHGRNRRPPRDPVNVCLSLAYTMLQAEAVRATHAAGLDPLLGFYHRPAFGRESLACDLMEPLRAFADRWVWLQWRSSRLRTEHFSVQDGACHMLKAGREHFYGAWEPDVEAARRWLRRACSTLARGLRRKGLPLLETPVEDDDD